MSNTSPEVYCELGNAGLTWAEAQKLMAEAAKLAAEQLQMNAEGRVPIPGTDRVLVFDGGIDGWDSRYFIERPASADVADVLPEDIRELLTQISGGHVRRWQHAAQRAAALLAKYPQESQ